MRRTVISLWTGLAVAVSLVAGNLAVAADATGTWLQWRGPDRANHAPDTGLIKSWETEAPKLEWMVEGVGKGYSSVSIADGRIYTMGNQSDGQAVIALDAKDGKILWKTSVTDGNPKHSYDGSRCTPSIDGDRLYVVTSNGSIACLKSADGTVVWQYEFSKWDGKMMSGWGYSESPLVDGDLVLCTPGGKKGMIVALDKMTGEEKWASIAPELEGNGKNGAGYSSIVISHACGVKQYVTIVGRGAIGVRASDGKFLWNYNRVANGTANIPTPIVDGDFVFVSTGYGTGAGLLKLVPEGDGVKVEEQYFLPGDKLQNHHGGMVKVGNYIYLGHAHNNGFPTCVKMLDGEIIWGGKLRGPGTGSAAVLFVDGNLIFRYQSGDVALIEATPDEYRLKGSFKPAHVEGPSWAHPVVVSGKLYLREQDKLMCYSLKAGS